ncbi:MAG: Ig-like domain-containing protein [Treponema sp.]|jgi:uncharacterized protein YjdB|nr:Ig-like domain-containing protein [Treponema sp.]
MKKTRKRSAALFAALVAVALVGCPSGTNDTTTNPVTGVTITLPGGTAAGASLDIGQGETITLGKTTAGGAPTEVTWESSNTDAVTVTSTGTIEGVGAPGTSALITVSASNADNETPVTDSITVTVKAANLGGSIVVNHSEALTISAVAISIYTSADSWDDAELLKTVDAAEDTDQEADSDTWSYAAYIDDSNEAVYLEAKVTVSVGVGGDDYDFTLKENETAAVTDEGADLSEAQFYAVTFTVGEHGSSASAVFAGGEPIAVPLDAETVYPALKDAALSLSAEGGTNYGKVIKVDGAAYEAEVTIDADKAVSITFPRKIDSVTITNATPLTIDVNGEITLEYEIAPEEAAATATVTWESDSNAVQVDTATGKITGKTAQGSATITASAKNDGMEEPVTDTIAVTVNETPNLGGSMTVNYVSPAEVTEVSLAIYQSSGKTNIIKTINATTSDHTNWSYLTFISDIPGTVYIVPTVTVSGVSFELAEETITASTSANLTTAQFYKISASAAGSGTLTVAGSFGESKVLQAQTLAWPVLPGATFTLATSNIAAGYEQTTLTVNTVDYTTEVTVNEDKTVAAAFTQKPITGVTIKLGSEAVTALVFDTAATATLTYEVTPADAIVESFTWGTDNESGATVGSASGLVTGVTTGQTAIITGTAANATSSIPATVTVTVRSNVIRQMIFDDLSTAGTGGFRETTQSPISGTGADPIFDYQLGGYTSKPSPSPVVLSTDYDHTNAGSGAHQSLKWPERPEKSARLKLDKIFSPADVGRTFNISLYMYSATATSVRVGAFRQSNVTSGGDGANPVSVITVSLTANEWTHVSWNTYTHTDPTVTQLAFDQIGSDTLVDTFYFDDILVTATPVVEIVVKSIIFDDLDAFTATTDNTTAPATINDWQGGGGTSSSNVTLSTDQDHTAGSGAHKSLKSANRTGAYYRIKFEKMFSTADIGRTFNASMWVYTGTATWIQLSAYALGGSVVIQRCLVRVEPGWNEVVWRGYTHTAAIDSNGNPATQLGIEQQGAESAVATLYIDDVLLTKVPVAD